MNYKILVLAVVVFPFLLSFSNDNTKDIIPENIETVTIGAQVWMKKNLDLDTYRNGDTIPNVTDSVEWANLTTGAWCYYNNDSANGKIYGKLYNWYAVNDTRGLAPVGWHIPRDNEWTILETFLGDASSAGGKLKDTGTCYWEEPNEGATNSSGFSALPGGYRFYNGAFFALGSEGNWWSSLIYGSSTAWKRTLLNGAIVVRCKYGKTGGLSVRCVKDKL